MISYEDFKKVEIKIGKILSAEKVQDTDKLLKLEVDFKEEKPRQIVSGIAGFATPESIIGKKVFFVANLEPRMIKGLESQGMLFAVGGEGDVPFSFVYADDDVPEGTAAR